MAARRKSSRCSFLGELWGSNEVECEALEARMLSGGGDFSGDCGRGRTLWRRDPTTRRQSEEERRPL